MEELKEKIMEYLDKHDAPTEWVLWALDFVSNKTNPARNANLAYKMSWMRGYYPYGRLVDAASLHDQAWSWELKAQYTRNTTPRHVRAMQLRAEGCRDSAARILATI